MSDTPRNKLSLKREATSEQFKLEERLHKRGTDEPHIITRRLLAAGGEIAHAPDFEYAIINEEFNVALAELQAIVKATRCRFAQQAARNATLFAQLGIHANQPQS